MNHAKFFRQIKNYRAYANDKCKNYKRCIAIYIEPMYVRFFVFVFVNEKRCGKENEVIKPQASVPSLSSKRNNSPTRCKRSYHKKGCQIFASTIDMVLHVRFISKCKEQLIPC